MNNNYLNISLLKRCIKITLLMFFIFGSGSFHEKGRLFLNANASERQEEIVLLNVNTHIYHYSKCTWAKRCTRSCIPVTRKEATERGARPCKVCGG